MPYATLNDLIDRYGERMLIDLTDREDVATGAINTHTVDQALQHASDEIDGYILNHYTLPMSQVPPTVVDLACVLSIWRLHTDHANDKITADHKAAQIKLKQIAEGVFRLPIDGVDPPFFNH